MADDNTRRVGLLLVHGVGEQHRFEHLEGETRQIAHCLMDTPEVDDVSVSVHTSRDSHYLADQVMWSAQAGAPVSIQFRHANVSHRWEFREVWWADLDERNTLWSQVRFWAWGLAQWAVAGRTADTPKPTDAVKMERPSPPGGVRPRKEWFQIRAKLFGIGIVFGLVLLTLSFINFVLTKFLKGRIPGADIVSSYVGDVKLLLQDRRREAGSITDLGLPPRVSVRRRMVRALIDMASDDYDRWYVLAHSLGTVVAFNGLMETELALANYLDEDEWDACEARGLGVRRTDESAAGKVMMPRRPLWLEDGDVIDRVKLFERLRGLVTYGSPLDKFSALWGHIVAINRQPAFDRQFQWINVFDETDSIAGPLDDFSNLKGATEPDPDDATPRHAAPENYAFSASPALLLSHLKYLQYDAGDRNRLVNRLCGWFAGDGPFPEPVSGSPGWGTRGAGLRGGRYAGSLVQWLVLGLALAGLLGWILSRLAVMLAPEISRRLGEMSVAGEPLATLPGLLTWSAIGLATVVLLVVVAGVLRLLRAHRLVH